MDIARASRTWQVTLLRYRLELSRVQAGVSGINRGRHWYCRTLSYQRKRFPDCLHCRQDELGGTSRNDTRGGYGVQPVWYFQPSLARSVWGRKRGLLEASGCSDSQE
ncbi:hypothetical protein FOPG_19698 [Fusarium oxysporum f. sp. conglutinans race 2 54008]|uniref:Uncharacterized protein n=1 Tax=Fusarium oxysporum f. sp. conglutinans race 2 54008 TaxID=1089457 RepID=X0GK68_FUSOX|nr:hypothetical protein FOPG_19698 [Fusarium oxysporum f. sp. conglutinans race 2 54008]